MDRKIYGIFALLVMLFLVSCDRLSSAPNEKSANQKENDAFVEKIAKSGEYKELVFLNHPDVVYYKVLKAPENPDGQKPYLNSKVRLKLSGRLISGEVFQPEEKMEVTIYAIDNKGQQVGVVKGLRYALQDMTVGEEREVIVPYNLGYGQFSHANGKIPPYSTLIFQVELLKITEL